MNAGSVPRRTLGGGGAQREGCGQPEGCGHDSVTPDEKLAASPNASLPGELRRLPFSACILNNGVQLGYMYIYWLTL